MEQNFKIRTAKLQDLDTVFGFVSHLEERTFDLESFTVTKE